MKTEQTPSQKLLAEIDAKINALKGLQSYIHSIAAILDAQGASASLSGMHDYIFIYKPSTEGAKAIAKAIGGQWRKDRNGLYYDYKGSLGDTEVIICHAEPVQEEPLVL
ncbi:MAG TPA: hypothetical protein VEH27_02415 [Methylomirabilota bacterium]|nr:hypothetical protein [Methylomirabilota bacterium]